jgi:hypothetical protein
MSAVEKHVRIRLIEIQGPVMLSFRVYSRVNTTTDRTDQPRTIATWTTIT